MMTSKLNLGSVKMTSEEARKFQLRERDETAKRILDNRLKIDENMVKPTLFYGCWKI